jgi:hypothetical protein
MSINRVARLAKFVWINHLHFGENPFTFALYPQVLTHSQSLITLKVGFRPQAVDNLGISGF